ncbi:hypothetical protein FOA43_001009 [Brettanomyces nanus]|uniref:CS domain-containing protein n=1 Tax=Eeniella nana TaxID=13502 RepID=A0A875RXC7_EENNA|nr:uncharacterized protein FOA43_001009 [Brettanomyces nanus]QPG73696.1 hypothetical protein FOA43_001009 [Brettanomyces nanus]
MTSIAPEVLWAQRSSDKIASKNIIFLTVRLLDPEDLKIDLSSNALKITAKSDDHDYKLDIEFFDEIDEKLSHYHVAGSHIAFILIKKKLEVKYWPRLTKEKAKYHYIRTDFEKWVDEDEQAEEAPQADHDDSEMSALPGQDQFDMAKLAEQYAGKGGAMMGGSE